MRSRNLYSRLAEMEARMPKDTIWYLADGTEFRSDLGIVELFEAGRREVEAGGPHPILDAAMQTVRSEDGSRLHELFRAMRGPLVEIEGKWVQTAPAIAPLGAARGPER